MEQQNKPRSINLNQARGQAPAQPAQQPRAGQPGSYGQAAQTQRSAPASGQVRRTAPQDPRTAQQARQSAQQYRGAPQSAQSAQSNVYQQRQQTVQRAQQQRPPQGGNPSYGQAGAQQSVRGSAPYSAQQSTQQRRPAQPAQPPQQRRAVQGSVPPSQQNVYVSQQRRAQQSAQSSRAAQPGSDRHRSGHSASPSSARRTGQTNKNKKLMNRFLIGMSSVFAVLLVAYIGFQVWGGTLINEGEMGTLNNVIATPPQFRGEQLNLLMIGIDYSTEDAVVRDPIGMTDMIMYIRFNFKDNTMKMLQIPRDFFVGENISTGGTGKINAVFKHSADTENRVNTLSQYIYDTFQLPVDEYATIDMDSLREMVDQFGGIEVYVPRDMEFAGSSLTQGTQVMNGAACEFFLRNRHGDGFATGDIARLDMQRYFYSGLFRRIRTATWQDIVKLMPVVRKYVQTSMSLNDSMGLAIKMLKIPSSNIMMCRMPTYDSAQNYGGAHAVQVGYIDGIASLLNENFRTEDAQVPASGLRVADWPHASVPHEANVQWMTDVDVEGGGTVGEAADPTQTGDDLLDTSGTASGVASADQPAA